MTNWKEIATAHEDEIRNAIIEVEREAARSTGQSNFVYYAVLKTDGTVETGYREAGVVGYGSLNGALYSDEEMCIHEIKDYDITSMDGWNDWYTTTSKFKEWAKEHQDDDGNYELAGVWYKTDPSPEENPDLFRAALNAYIDNDENFADYVSGKVDEFLAELEE